MTRRSITWILCIAAIALACGPHARHGDGDAHASVPNAREAKPLTDTSLVASAPCATETWPAVSAKCLRTATPDQALAKARVVVAR